MLYLPSKSKSNNNKRNNDLTPHGLPKYEPPPSIMQKNECVTSMPMITSKNDNEYDYVLVIKDNNNQNLNLGIDPRSTLNYRREIMRRLDHAELIVNPEKHRIGNLYLIKIRADDELLEEWAEKMHLLMRLDGSGVYAPFQRTLKSQFQIRTFFPDSVFRSSERQLIIHEILHRKEWENGVELNQQILPSIVYMYPLHIKERKNELYWKWNHGYNSWEFPTNVNSKKQVINNITKVFNFLWPTQPLNDIVEYFGEEVGFYFALVEYFVKWLYVPTIAGTVIFFIQLKRFHGNENDPNAEQCNSKSGGNDNPLWFHIETCESILPYFSLFMTIWTTTFIQFWKRRQIKLAHQWGVLNYEQKDHKTRLSYKQLFKQRQGSNGDTTTINKNTISYNLKMRACKVIVTTPIIFLLVISCIVFMFWFLAMRASIKSSSDSDNAGNVFFGYVTHTLLWGLIVPLLSGLHIKICQYLNDWENWRTESDHYKYYTAKVCSLLLINTFVAMYYLCCFEQSLPSVAFQVASFMIARLFLDIFVSIVIMPYLRKYKIKRVIKQNKKYEYDPSSIHNPNDNNFDEISHHHHKINKNNKLGDDDNMSVISNNNDKNAKVIDMTGDYARIKNSQAWHQALSPQYDSFKNYCFLILFFGYVSNFSIAFCLAPLVALIGMLFKLRSDRFHLCCNTQRPLPRRVSGIGIWLTVLDQMCTFAIITNMLIIYFTTNMMMIKYKYKIQFLIIFEHLLLGIRFGLKLIIPEMPLPVKAEIRLHQLTRLSRRKKLLEKAQSQYQGKGNKKKRRNNINKLNNQRVYYNKNRNSDYQTRDNSIRQCSVHSIQSNKSVLTNNSRHHTTNIHIDDFVHAIY